MEPFPDARPLEAQRSFSRRPQTQDRVSTRLEQPQVAPDPASRPTFLKLFNFYTGVTLSLCGVGAFLAGATSRKWVEVEVTVPQGVRLGYKLQTLAHMGPWLACNHNKHCDRPWILAPGLDEQSVRGVQTMLIFTIFIYLSGAAVVVLQLLRPKRLLYLRFCKCLLNNAFAEGLLPVAAVMAFLFILMMGELKRKLILQVDQTSRPGWAFVVCLTSVLATVVGSVCMIFNRQRNDRVRASCVTMFRPMSPHSSSKMLEKKESVRRGLVTLSTTQQDSDMRIAADNHNLSGGDSCSGVEAGREHNNDKCMVQTEHSCKAGAESNRPNASHVFTTVERPGHKGIAAPSNNLAKMREHVFTHSVSMPSREQQMAVTIPTLQTPMGEHGRGARSVYVCECDERGRQIARSRPQPLHKPHLLNGQSDWSSFYGASHEITAHEGRGLDGSLQSELVDVACVASSACDDSSKTSNKMEQSEHKAQDIDFQTGEVTL